MKEYNKITYICLMFLFALFCGCEEDEDVYDTSALRERVIQAEGLLDGAEEGQEIGDYMPGSVSTFQGVVNWCKWKMEDGNATGPEDVAEALGRLNFHVNKFQTNHVQAASIYNPGGNKFTGVSFGSMEFFIGADKPAFTSEIWVYIDEAGQKTAGGLQGLMGMINQGPDRGWQVRYHKNDKKFLIMCATSGNRWNERLGSTIVEPNKWYHLAATCDYNGLKLYVNGEMEVEFTTTYSDPTGSELRLGNNCWQRTLMGSIKEFKLWEGIRTQEQIQADMTEKPTADTEGLEIYCPLDRTLGTSFMDVTGKHRANFVGNLEWRIPPFEDVVTE